jgi:NarL family two-component system response regulator LiaR
MHWRIHVNKTIQILIADDHELVRKGLITLFASEPGIEVIGEAVDGYEVVLKARSLKPDVILLDMIMPRQNGLEAIEQIKRENPEARILVITSFGEDQMLLSAIKAGALGYLLKDSSPQRLFQAIQDVYNGESSLHPTIALKLIRELNRSPNPTPTENVLTERELIIVKLVAQGLTNQEIAEKLVISERTVGNHISNILGKLHLTNRTQAALYALREGLADLGGKSEPASVDVFTPSW